MLTTAHFYTDDGRAKMCSVSECKLINMNGSSKAVSLMILASSSDYISPRLVLLWQLNHME
jgi:hypothetical protein